MSYDDAGVRCTMLRGGTSRGLYFEADDLPADPAVRDALLLRLMGSPDARQIDGLGGATSLTSKVAVVGRSADTDADVDYLFLQLGVAEATVSDRQNCGNILAGVGPFAVERGLVPARPGETTVRIRMVNSDSVAVATFPTPGGRVEYRGDVAIDGVPGTAAPVVLAFTGTEGSAAGCCPPVTRGMWSTASTSPASTTACPWCRPGPSLSASPVTRRPNGWRVTAPCCGGSTPSASKPVS